MMMIIGDRDGGNIQRLVEPYYFQYLSINKTHSIVFQVSKTSTYGLLSPTARSFPGLTVASTPLFTGFSVNSSLKSSIKSLDAID